LISFTTGLVFIVDSLIGSLSFDSAFPSILKVRKVNNLAPLLKRSFEFKETFDALIHKKKDENKNKNI